jgi:hypothetical protein
MSALDLATGVEQLPEKTVGQKDGDEVLTSYASSLSATVANKEISSTDDDEKKGDDDAASAKADTPKKLKAESDAVADAGMEEKEIGAQTAVDERESRYLEGSEFISLQSLPSFHSFPRVVQGVRPRIYGRLLGCSVDVGYGKRRSNLLSCTGFGALLGSFRCGFYEGIDC